MPEIKQIKFQATGKQKTVGCMWWYKLQCEKTVLSIPQGVCFPDVPKLSADIIHVTECAPMDLGVDLNLGSKQYSQTLWGKGECKWRMRMKGGKGGKEGHGFAERKQRCCFLLHKGNCRLYLTTEETENQDILKQCCILLIIHMVEKQWCDSIPWVSNDT